MAGGTLDPEQLKREQAELEERERREVGARSIEEMKADAAAPTAPGVIALAEAIYDHRNAFGAALAAWAELPDEPEAVIAILIGSGEDFPSPTMLAENLQRASGDLRRLTAALGTGNSGG